MAGGAVATVPPEPKVASSVPSELKRASSMSATAKKDPVTTMRPSVWMATEGMVLRVPMLTYPAPLLPKLAAESKTFNG